LGAQIGEDTAHQVVRPDTEQFGGHVTALESERGGQQRGGQHTTEVEDEALRWWSYSHCRHVSGGRSHVSGERVDPAQTIAQQTRQEFPRKRADARRNHERVFAAALEVFEEFGLQGTIPQVAECSDVGRATVYRSYPTKEDLVAAAVRHRLAKLDRTTAPALAKTESARAFDTYVVLLCDNLARDRLLSEALVEGRSTAYTGDTFETGSQELFSHTG
jgi:hypothetical protein